MEGKISEKRKKIRPSRADKVHVEVNEAAALEGAPL